MQIIPLYRYTRPDGGVTVSTEKPDGDFTELCRVAADDGCVLTDGENITVCIDTDTPDAWQEVEITENMTGGEDYERS